MKLNLVPTYVSKERQGRSAMVIGVLLAVAGIVASFMLITSSRHALDDAKAANDNSKPPAQAAVDMSNEADTVIANAAQIIKDTNLAQAMISHNDVYPDFYSRTIIPYIPPFFRLTTLSAQPIDGTTSVVTMVGTIKSYQQYADLSLALMRIPGAMSVGRAGYSGEQSMVPALTPEDQVGRRRKTTDATIPDDPAARLQYYESLGSAPPGYLGTGNFGSGTTDTRGATPDESLITITLTVAKNLMTPDPRATVSSSGPAGAAGAATTGLSTGMPGMPPGMGPGGPGGPPPGLNPNSAPPTPPATGSSAKGDD